MKCTFCFIDENGRPQYETFEAARPVVSFNGDQIAYYDFVSIEATEVNYVPALELTRVWMNM